MHKRALYGSFCCIAYSLLLGIACQKEKLATQWHTQWLPTTYPVNALAFSSPLQGYAVGGNIWYSGQLFSTSDGGAHWQLDTVGIRQLYTLSCQHDTCVAAGIGEEVWRRTAPSAPWQRLPSPTGEIYRAVAATPQRTIVAGGAAFKDGWIYTLDTHWQLLAAFRPPHEIAALGIFDTYTFLAAGYGAVYRSTDAGNTWQQLALSGEFFISISVIDARTAYMVGRTGSILRTTDAGVSWQWLRKADKWWVRDHSFTTCAFLNAQQGYIGGDAGLLWRTQDGGNTWQPYTTLPDVDITDIAIYDKAIWLSTQQGIILQSMVE